MFQPDKPSKSGFAGGTLEYDQEASQSRDRQIFKQMPQLGGHKGDLSKEDS